MTGPLLKLTNKLEYCSTKIVIPVVCRPLIITNELLFASTFILDFSSTQTKFQNNDFQKKWAQLLSNLASRRSFC